VIRTDYYEAMKRLAAEKREKYGVATPKLGLQKIREIYKTEGIVIDLWDTSARIRAVYMCDDGEPSVLVNRKLPKIPKLFAMTHELKHHYCDQSALKKCEIRCGDYNANEVIEKAAEVFAAEFIFPEGEFLACVESLGLQRGKVTAEDVVEIKRICSAQVSYKFLQKRLEWFQFIEPAKFAKVQFQKPGGYDLRRSDLSAALVPGSATEIDLRLRLVFTNNVVIWEIRGQAVRIPSF
jgi:Zn-dependent peptidase ImmA (M78 family)